MKKIVLIDGNSIMNRAFYGVPDLSNSKGLHTNAVYGFLNILFKILDEEKPDYAAVAFDLKEPTFRHKMYGEYKGTRKPMPGELREQMPVIKDVLAAMEITIMEQAGFEADDLLGTLAQKGEQEGMEVSVLSGDRDLLQLVTDHIKVRIPKTKQGGTEIEDYYPKDVVEKYGVTPVQVIDLKGLMGDASDNIPGVPGVGEKTAVKLLAQYPTVEEAYEHLDEVKPQRVQNLLREHKDMAFLSKQLATIKTDCELAFGLEDCVLNREAVYTEEVFRILKDLEFKSLLNRFSLKMDQSQTGNDLKRDLILCNDRKQWDAFEKQAQPVYGTKGAVIGLSMYQIEDAVCFGVGLSCSKDKEHAVYISMGTSGITTDDLLTFLVQSVQNGALIAAEEIKEKWQFFTSDQDKSAVLKPAMRDVSIAAYLLNPLKDSYHADDLARDYLGMTIPSFSEAFGKRTMMDVSMDAAFPEFAAREAVSVQEAYPVLMSQLSRQDMAWLYEEVELPLTFVLYDMEKEGVLVNRQALEEYGDKLGKRIVTLEEEIYQKAGEKFNINSPKQLGVVLFEHMHMPFAKKTKTGYSTSADILEKLRCEHPIVSDILEYRQLTKLKSTYADGLSHFISSDGRIHGKMNQTVTATGRLSSTEPNLQNIPIRMELGREIRKVFIPKEGFVFLDADYSQIELRILAHMSGDEKLINAYRQNEDIHRITASEVFHVPFEEVTELERRNAKAVNFGIIYGISSFGLGQDLNITRKEAEKFIKKYFETYPTVKTFLDDQVAMGKEKGYVESLYHRIRPVPELSSSNYMQRSFGERVAMNSPIQGTAADIMKIAMVRVAQRLEKEGLQSRLLLQIHDEILVETEQSEVDKVAAIMEEEMNHAADLKVPLEVEVKQGNSWFEAK